MMRKTDAYFLKQSSNDDRVMIVIKAFLYGNKESI